MVLPASFHHHLRLVSSSFRHWEAQVLSPPASLQPVGVVGEGRTHLGLGAIFLGGTGFCYFSLNLFPALCLGLLHLRSIGEYLLDGSPNSVWSPVACASAQVGQFDCSPPFHFSPAQTISRYFLEVKRDKKRYDSSCISCPIW